MQDEVFHPATNAHWSVLSCSRKPCLREFILVGRNRVTFVEVWDIQGTLGNDVGFPEGDAGGLGQMS